MEVSRGSFKRNDLKDKECLDFGLLVSQGNFPDRSRSIVFPILKKSFSNNRGWNLRTELFTPILSLHTKLS